MPRSQVLVLTAFETIFVHSIGCQLLSSPLSLDPQFESRCRINAMSGPSRPFSGRPVDSYSCNWPNLAFNTRPIPLARCFQVEASNNGGEYIAMILPLVLTFSSHASLLNLDQESTLHPPRHKARDSCYHQQPPSCLAELSSLRPTPSASRRLSP